MKSITILICAMALVGCSLTSNDLDNADKLCTANGGVTGIDVGPFRHDVYCNDGAVFQDRVRAFSKVTK